ncbi:MAG TPA: 3-hydroxyacyl-CoA dehydrogenase family protein [Solirubrobacterales bacterium]|nr:3-hydroxyacyl-CoA dehydrogenase family protein [Solirubrobacterales bacterium]
MKVAVVGAGIMGSGVGQLVAMSGGEARVRDVDATQLERAEQGVEKSLARFVKAGKMSAEESADAAARVEYTTDLAAALEGAEVVVEAVPEDYELKRRVLAEIGELAPAEALLGTNTSQLSITSLASVLGDGASRLVGIHFFNPPVMMKLVEVIAGTETEPAQVERAVEFGRALGRETVVCRKDVPGFLTSRAYAILRLECVKMLEEGVASAEDIDKALKLGFNFPMGPLELGDMNGIDTYVHALEGLERAHGDRFRPTVGLRNMVAANRLGRKTGAGFYDYDPSPKTS